MRTPAPTPVAPAAAPEPQPQAWVRWQHVGQPQQALWLAEAGWPPPARVQPADDQVPADRAYKLICEGTALLWQGDFHNARQLLQALARRIDRPARRAAPPPAADAPGAAFHRLRQQQGRRARLLAMLLVPVEAAGGRWRVPLRRAPDVHAACAEAWGPPDGPHGSAGSADASAAPAAPTRVVALRELQGLVGAHEWRKAGVDIPALGPPPGNRIHAHYGVFSPVRGEYLDLIAQAPLPAGCELAFDIGTGTGVVAAVLARRGVPRVVATDLEPRALACAQDNIVRLGLQGRVELLRADLFPPGQAALVVCNPPWLPARPSSRLEHAVYDEGGRMLRGFLAGLRAHLAPGGEGWLVMSDLAEHLGLRAPGELQGLIGAAGLAVRQRHDIRPRHPKAADASDPLAAARGREVTSLWRLVAAA